MTQLGIEIRKIRLTDFMKALGQEQPIYADGNLRRYNAPYRDDKEASMVINIETNQWRDVKTGSYGGIYDLAYEMTESCSMSDLNLYIATQMSGLKKVEAKIEPPKPKMKMRR